MWLCEGKLKVKNTSDWRPRLRKARTLISSHNRERGYEPRRNVQARRINPL